MAVGTASPGAFLGKRLLRRVTLRAIQLLVAGTMLLVGGGLALGLL